MVFKIRVILDIKEDVIRTILIQDSKTLEDLHKTISKEFGFNGQQMASFYQTDNDWNQGKEIPLINMDEDSLNPICMATTTIKENIKMLGEKLIYVYDFLEMWTFYVELVEISENLLEKDLPKLILSIGNVPEKAPNKEFKSSKTEKKEAEFDEFESIEDSDEFENLDNFDFDNY